MERILVTGGAGYVGSHAVRGLLRAGHAVTVFDNLVAGHRGAIEAISAADGNVSLVEGDEALWVLGRQKNARGIVDADYRIPRRMHDQKGLAE